MYGFYGTGFPIVLTLLIVILFYSRLAPLIPLYNQMPWGEARIGTKNQIFFPIVLGFIIFLVNLFLSSRLREKAPLLARMLSVVSILTSFLLLTFIIRTVRLVL